MADTEKEFWNNCFQVGAIKRAKPKTSLYDVLQEHENLKQVQAYIGNGHDVNQKFSGSYVIHEAVKQGKLELVEFLHTKGAKITGLGESPLIATIDRLNRSIDESYNEAESILQYLLSHNLPECDLAYAYVNCAVRKQYSAAKAIKNAGLPANVEYSYQYQKSKPLVQYLIDGGYPEFANVLSGGNVDETWLRQQELAERQQNAELHAKFNNLKTNEAPWRLSGEELIEKRISFLEEIKADKWNDHLESRGPRHVGSAIEFFTLNDLDDFVKVTLDKTNYSEYWESAAKIAATYGNLSILKALHQHKTNLTNYKEDGPLVFACQYGHLNCVEFLLELGANPRSKDNNGIDVMKLVNGPGKSAIEALLKSKVKESKGGSKTGFSVKGKAKNWAGHQLKAITDMLSHGYFCVFHTQSTFSTFLPELSEKLSDNQILSAEKNAIPMGNGAFIYALKNTEGCYMVPAGTKDFALSGFSSRAIDIAKGSASSKNIINTVCVFETTSGSQSIFRYSNGDELLGEFEEETVEDSLALKVLTENELVIVPYSIETDGFNQKICFRNIKKTDIQHIAFVDM